jgi:hypothetical protein
MKRQFHETITESMKRVFLALLCGAFLVSCVSPPRAPSDHEITRLAREKVSAELPSLDAASKDQIENEPPQIKWKTIDWYLEYQLSWRLISNRTLLVMGTWSEREKLKYSRIELQQQE